MPHLNEPGAPEIPYATVELEDGRVVLILPFGWRQSEQQGREHGPLGQSANDDVWAAHAYWMETASETVDYRESLLAAASRTDALRAEVP